MSNVSDYSNEYATNSGVTATQMMANVLMSKPLNIPDHSKLAKRTIKASAPKAVKAPKPVIAKVAKVPTNKPSKIVHPDGTIFFRADRNKWIAMADGKQEAARDTVEKCIAFLNKKYPTLTPVVMPKE